MIAVSTATPTEPSTSQQATEDLSTKAMTTIITNQSTNDSTTKIPEEGKGTWIILVAALPILGGLIFLVALAVWYNRRKKAKVRFNQH